jgi:hypothetical protein
MYTGVAHKIGAVLASISLLLMTSIGDAHSNRWDGWTPVE